MDIVPPPLVTMPVTEADDIQMASQPADRVVEYTMPLNDQREKPLLEQMITFDMMVDEEVSIPAGGTKGTCSQASIGGADEVFFSAASGSSYSLVHQQPSQEPVMMAIEPVQEVTLVKMPAVIPGNVSRESIPELVDSGYTRTTPNNGVTKRNSLTNAVESIDPHGLIAFESPSRFPRSTVSCAQLPAGLSLLDVDIMASPLSMAKYSQRDFDRLKGEFERRAEKQAEFMQFEIQTIQERYDASLQANNELRILMKEYENTMTQILDARKQQKGDHLATIEQLLQDKRNLQVELQTGHVTYQNLHSRYEDVKSLNEQLKVHEQSLKATIAGLQAELTNADRRYETLKQHAEQKLQEANIQIQRVQASMDVELSATKAKLLKAELRIGSLEEQLAGKIRENKELEAICDELIQKIDPNSAAVCALPS